MAAMDQMAFGTMQSQWHEADEMYAATKHAIASGFRHIDTAELYHSTVAHVGRAISESGVPREQLFITSKIQGLPTGDLAAIETRLQQHLALLQTSYVDLLLVHYPGPNSADPTVQSPDEVQDACSFAWFQQHIEQAWRNMMALRSKNLVRFIGVSNFYEHHLRELCRLFPDTANQPYANQLYIDIAHQERDYVASMQQQQIRVFAYRPLAFVSNLAMLSEMGDLSVDQEIATARAAVPDACSVQQLILAVLLARGIGVVSNSCNNEHIEQSLLAKQLLAKHGAELLASLLLSVDNNEMLQMCMAFDEYAMAYKNTAPVDAGHGDA
jgi:diketogulonate reductase-like aldo/keto reductase